MLGDPAVQEYFTSSLAGRWLEIAAPTPQMPNSDPLYTPFMGAANVRVIDFLTPNEMEPYLDTDYVSVMSQYVGFFAWNAGSSQRTNTSMAPSTNA